MGAAPGRETLPSTSSLFNDYEDSGRPGEIRCQYGARLADALIAATALIRNLPAVDPQLQYFTAIEGRRVEKPYD